MTNFIRKYWAEVLVFGAIFASLMITCIPDITWINTDCDGPHYIYSAKYLYPAHKTSAPLFLLLGNLFLRIPFGTEAWRLSLLSVFATMGTCIFIYLSAKWHTSNKWYALIGTVVFAGSALVISQSTIVESYALTTMLGTGAYYFSIKKKWWLCAIMLGAGLAVHTLGLIPIIIIMVKNKEFRCYEYAGVIAAFALFYLYIPLTNREPYMWHSPNSELGTSFFIDNLSTVSMLMGGISIWDFPKRVLDALGILAVSFTIALVPLVIGMRAEKLIKNPLFWLFILPIGFYMTNLAPQTYVYLMPSLAIGGIIVAIGLTKIRVKYFALATAGIAIGMIIFNTNYFDVGRTLDSELSARKFWNEELKKIPDGQILLAQQGWEWAMVYPYNRDENREIIPICNTTLASEQYQDMIREWGVEFESPPDDMTLVDKQMFIMKSIVANNENVWTTFPTKPEVYESEVEPLFMNIWTGNGIEQIIHQENYDRMEESLFMPQSISIDSANIEWKWKPSNPYDIITGAIEVEEWVFIIFSNYSVMTFLMCGAIGGIPIMIGIKFFRKKRWSLKNIKENFQEI